MYDPIVALREIIVELDRLPEIPVSGATMSRARQTIEQSTPWANLPKQYQGRWSFDYDEKRGFFVHCNGHNICQSEDSEVCDAICRAHNSSIYVLSH